MQLLGKGEFGPESRVQQVASPVDTARRYLPGLLAKTPARTMPAKKIQYEKLFWQFHKSSFLFFTQDIHVLVMLVLVFFVTDLSHSNVLMSQSTYNFK